MKKKNKNSSDESQMKRKKNGDDIHSNLYSIENPETENKTFRIKATDLLVN